MFKNNLQQEIEVFAVDLSSPLLVPLFSDIRAGFPSPAADYLEDVLDLNKEVVKDPSATFFGKVVGDSMIEEGIFPGSILVVDRSLSVQDNDLVVARYEGGFILKRVKLEDKQVLLVSSNIRYKPIIVTSENEFILWGVVTYIFHKTRIKNHVRNSRLQ